MKALTKIAAGAATAAALTLSAVSPAQAQSWERRHYDRDRGVDVGDVITGVAVLGGIAAIASALGRDGNRYGYDNRYRYRNDYRNAVNSCAYQAQRYGQGGQVQIVDIDRRGRNSYRVRGVIDAGYGGYGGGYDRYDRFDRRGYNGYGQRIRFACTARANGRITDFDIGR